MTNQRRKILDTVKKSASHPTAYEVYEEVRKNLPRISLGTVYRNLETLSEKGMIEKIEMSANQRHYDGRTDVHYHIRCLNCGRIDDIPLQALTALEETAARESGYFVAGHALEFVGTCPRCLGDKNEND